MIVLKQIFYEVGPKRKSRRKVVHDVKKVEKHCSRRLPISFSFREVVEICGDCVSCIEWYPKDRLTPQNEYILNHNHHFGSTSLDLN